MKKLLLVGVLAIACAGFVVTGGNGAPSYVITLDGANALPPNQSVLTAEANIYAPQPFPITPYTYCFPISVRISLALLTNEPYVLPSVVSIQRQNGDLVTDAYDPEYPFFLDSFGPPDDIPFWPGIVYPRFMFIGTEFFGRFAITPEQVAKVESGQWYVEMSFVAEDGTPLPENTIRAQIPPRDDDHDGVPDYKDQCRETLPGAVVDAHGCSIDDLCPCDSPWRSRGEYLTCVSRTAAQFQRDGLISESQRRTIVNAAIRSRCGKH